MSNTKTNALVDVATLPQHLNRQDTAIELLQFVF